MKLDKLYKSILCCSLALPLSVIAQDDADDEAGELENIEEIVVTGSFIKREKFDMASPVETIDAVDIQTSGYTNMGPYIRDLTYTTNVDTVANVLATSSGQQDSNSARFNLRGLGTSSTLTLMDGRRVLNSGAVAGILPDIAMEQVEVILDGGSATYGTDAVAGVVNLIPIQEYDGVKVRGFYTRDGEGDFYEPKVSLLAGKSWDKFNLVGALEYSEREDSLQRSDRPKYLRADNDTSTSGNPGSFTQFGVLPVIDPGCGTANEGRTDDGLAGAYPSGLVAFGGFVCTLEYGQWQDYKRPNEDLIGYVSATYDLNEDVALKALLNHNDRTSTLISSPSTAERGSNDLMPISPTHPNSPFFTTVTPRGWRPFSDNGATQPSHLNDDGSLTSDFNYVTTSLSLGSEFSFGTSSWTGEAWLTQAQSTTEITANFLNLDRLTLALQGQGGLDGDQWFNPFFSASPLSDNYVDCETGTGPGCSANSQQLVNWLYEKETYESSETDYTSVEGFVTGDIFELPSGVVQMAVGAQFRETEFTTQGNPLARRPSTIHTSAADDGGPAGQDYNSAVINGVSGRSSSESAVSSAFTEFLVPILDNLEMTVAARYEDFRDLDLSATVPKVAFRYQPLENLAIRASYGEGFLAPTVSEITDEDNPGCAELFIGDDPTGIDSSLIGALSCSNGNPQLDPEESEIFNIGATWQATDSWEFSLDYQQIDYEDRIIRLSTTDTLSVDFSNFLDAQDLTLTEWEALNDTQQQNLFLPWIGSAGEDPGITRDPSGDVLRVVRRPDNIAAVEVDVIDFRANYDTDLGDWGYFTARWSTTAYTKYDYLNAFGETVDASGKRNANTDIAPPLPEMKHQLRLGWMLDSHNVGLTFKHQDEVEFDGTVGPAFGPGQAFPAPDTIDAQTIVDLRYGYTFEEVAGGRLQLGLGANNLLDEEAQALPVPGGLETRLQDPTGRMLFVEATYSFE